MYRATSAAVTAAAIHDPGRALSSKPPKPRASLKLYMQRARAAAMRAETTGRPVATAALINADVQAVSFAVFCTQVIER